MLIKLAWRNLWRNKRRTFITMAAVFLAVMLAITMNSLQTGVYDNMIDNVVGNFSGYVQIHKNGYWDDQNLDNGFFADEETLQKAKNHPKVTQVIPRLESFALASSGDISNGSMVTGVNPAAEEAFSGLSKKLVEGAYFSDASGPEALIGKELAKKLELGVGDTIVMLGQGYHGALASGKYSIKGLLNLGSPELNSRIVFLPLEEAQEMYAADGLLTSYVLKLDRPDGATQVVAEFQDNLIDLEKYEVMEWKTMMPDIVQFIQADKGGNVLMLGILYMIVGFGIFGTILMMTAERKFEFGVMVAIGMKKRKLANTVVFETILISFLGVILGSLVSLPIVLYLKYSPIRVDSLAEAYAEFGFEPVFPAIVDPQIFLTEAITVLIMALIISFYPAIRMLWLNPVKAMRS